MSVKINDVPFIPLPPGVALAQRKVAHEQWKQLFIAANPSYFHPDGTRRSVWHRIASTFFRTDR